ncbi:GGDEF domain-containing protein [Methylobacterium soli]|uniref:GGDEF domain-containing protein n=1 Tax=Methylobacterium soli TaxID=553447 RepID=UPI0017818574|nr:sensor domain-containing diguanylate cyclase [Methylobacterium soli]
MFAVIGLCAVSVFMLWQMRLDAARRTEITSRSLIQVLGRDIARNIELYDLSLRAVVDGMKRPDVADLSPDLRHMLLFDRAATALGYGSIVVLDAAGNVVTSSQSAIPPAFNSADREYFRYFATHADDDLHVSSPSVSRLSGQWVITLSRRISNPDGSFAGVVAGAIFLDYFRGLFTAAGVDHAGTVTLYGPGGTVAMREPFDPRQIGTSVADTASYLEILKAKSGSFVGPAMLGAGDRHFAFAHIGDYPLQLSAAVPPGEIYADWQRKALGLGSVVLCLCGVTMLLTWLFGRELAQRRRAEEATAELNIELAQLATTDALTGLANRRRFDAVLAQEWRRSVRSQQPLSLLVIDADYFKGFNDKYGHQKGDEALKLIARSIEAATDPSHDISCRIGGEEFAVILPDTDVEGAIIVADRIRDTVAGWKLAHAASPHGVVTVSCGLAQIPRTPAVDPAALIAAADKALYEAKRLGRDRVGVAGRVVSNLRLASAL